MTPLGEPMEVSLTPPLDPVYRRACRVLTMVHELHKVGYQRLRIYSGMAPSGCHWRCHIVPADNVATGNGQPLDWEHRVASYSTGQGNRYFDWPDAAGDSARELAVKFIQRFPGIVRSGQGVDWAYAGWFVFMLGVAEHGRLPIFFADYPLERVPDEQPPPP
jgi:hypothetical protein